MDLPLTGSLNRPVELLRIETEAFTFYLQGKPFHPTVETLQLHRQDDEQWVDSHLHWSSPTNTIQVTSAAIFSPERGELVPWKLGEACPPLFYEAQGYELVVEKHTEIEITFYHNSVHLRDAVLPKGKRLLSGMLNFQNEIGHTELELRVYGETVFRVQLEIFPSKMDYKKDYQRILSEVNEQIYNLSFDFLRKTYHLTGLKETKNQSLTEFFAILQHVFQQLIQAVERIQYAPHHKLQRENRIVDAPRVKKAGKESLSFLTKRPHLLVQDDKFGFVSVDGRRMLPTHVLESKRHVDYDTLENRFVRWVLLRIQQKLKSLKGWIRKKDRTHDPILMKKIDQMLNDLQRLYKLDFLQVGDMRQMTISLVLQMALGYRGV